MIYKSISIGRSIQQGDIFHNLSLVRYDLNDLSVIDDNERIEQTSWTEITRDNVNIVANLERTYGIVMTQDCDCLRNTYISLGMIRPWRRDITSVNKWMKAIINLNNKEPSKMYLPPDKTFNIPERMFIDFSTIFYILRENLEGLRNLRLCRLNNEALEHFREKLASYFHRYSYDEYYPLNIQEIEEYEKWRGITYTRRRYQKP